MLESVKDAFIIHSKGDPRESELASRLIALLVSIGIPVYEYDDWQWARREPGKVRYSSSGNDLDLIRYTAGDPEPFRRQDWEEVADRDALDEMLGKCRVVVFIAPRSGSPSPGVDIERRVLPREPAVVLVSWGDQNEWLVEEKRHGYLHRIATSFNPDLESAALDLAHAVWLHWVLDHLALDNKGAGRSLLLELAQKEPGIRRILRLSGRMSKSLGKRLDDASGETTSALESVMESLVASTPVPGARPVVSHWWGRSSLQAVLPLPPGRELASLIDGASKVLDSFCDAALRRYPELTDDLSDALRLRASHAHALEHASLAMQHLDDALDLLGSSAAARSQVLADRAAMTLRSSPTAAEADIEAVLRLSGAAGMATSQALWLRAHLRSRRREAADAISDLSAALSLPEIAPVLRALCLHERALIRARAGECEQALQDLDDALRIHGLPGVIVGPALLDRAVQNGKLGNVERELTDYTHVIELKGVPDQTRLKAHMYRGLTRRDRGDRVGAVEDFRVVRDDEASRPEAKRAASKNLDKLDPLK